MHTPTYPRPKQLARRGALRARSVLVACIAAVCALALSACGGPSAATTPSEDLPPAVATSDVAVLDNRFDPVSAEVAVGDTVTWTWQGNAMHNVVGDAFESDAQQEGTFTQQFDAAGTYAYRCTLHPDMVGRIVVIDAAGGR